MTEAAKIGRAKALAFIKSLDNFPEGWVDDEDGPVETQTEVRYEDPDDKKRGIELRDPNREMAKKSARILSMRKRYKDASALFSQDEVEEDAVDSATATTEAPIADPNDINRRLEHHNYTLLIKAAADGNYDECKRLKEAGADLTLMDTSGKMAWQKAKDRGYDDIAELLRPS